MVDLQEAFFDVIKTLNTKALDFNMTECYSKKDDRLSYKKEEGGMI